MLWACLTSAILVLGETDQCDCVIFPAMPGCQGDVSRKVNLTMCWALSIRLFGPILHPFSFGLVFWKAAVQEEFTGFLGLRIGFGQWQQAQNETGWQEAVRCLCYFSTLSQVARGRPGYIPL